MLTQQQVFHFNTFGFLIFRQMFSPDEIKTINVEFRAALEAAYRHAPFDGTKRHWVTMMGPDTPFFASLLEDPRFYEVAEQLYGEDAFGVMTDANRYVGDTGWHPDTGSLHQYALKFAYYLDPVGAETGALRVIPGSHKDPFHSELLHRLHPSGMSIRDVPAYVCESEPGDVVAFDVRLWHGSCGGSEDRRMCTTLYYNNPKTPEEETMTRKQAAAYLRLPAHFERPHDPLYDPHWMANPDGSSRRQRWLHRMQELGFFESAP